LSVFRATLALVGLLALPACDQWHLSVNSDGLVFISVIGDGAGPGGRFRVRTRDGGGNIRLLDVPASGQLTLTAQADGELLLTLLAPEGCQVAGPNPRSLALSQGQEARVAFDVRCS
jgi:hypothetical protein